MKNIYYLLSVLLFLPLAVMAEDTVGAYDGDGYYVAHLPWSESFDNYGGNYDGTSMLPNGWMASGDVPFRTAVSASMPARTGTYYLVTEPSDSPRHDRAYTPYFDLKAGETYTFSFWLWMPGQKGYGMTNDLVLTVGPEQDYEMQPVTLLTLSAERCEQWTQYTVNYIPEEDGLHTFCFHLLTQAPLGGYVGIEDVSLLDAHQVLPPNADFAVQGNVDLFTAELMQFPSGHLHFVNLSTEATDYEWSIPGASPSLSTEKDVDVFFPASGTYTVTLTASNASGQQTCSRDISLGLYDKSQTTMAFQNHIDGVDRTLARGEVPTFATDPENDFYTGPNHYYRVMAERYEMPANQSLDITQLNYFMTNFSFIASTSETTWPVQKNIPITVSIVGEKDGLPDENQVFGSKTGPMSQMIKDRGIGVGEMRGFVFDNPVHVTGTFYVVLSFPEEFIIDTPDHFIGRSYFAMSPSVHRHGRATMYVKPHHNLDGTLADGQWLNAADFSEDLAGFGLFYYVWASNYQPDMTGVASVNAESVLAYPVFTIEGRPANMQNLPAGLYITNNKKFIRK